MINYQVSPEGESGSGLEQVTTPLAFPETEVVGQLYSYRMNSSAAVLRTRMWEPFRGQEVAIGVQQVAIGVQQAGSGVYMSLAANTNDTSDQTVTITVQGTYVHSWMFHLYIGNKLCV